MYFSISLNPDQENKLNGQTLRSFPVARICEKEWVDDEETGGMKMLALPTKQKVYIVERTTPNLSQELDLNGYPKILRPLWLSRDGGLGNSVGIYGPSGCGKSTIAGNLIREYHKRFPKRRVFIISPNDDDPAFASLDYVNWLEVDERIISESPLTVDEFKESLVVFDDYLQYENPKISAALQQLATKILTRGRKDRVDCIIIAHNAFNNNLTTNLNMNVGAMVLFSSGAQKKHLMNYLKNLGCNQQTINKVLNLPTRSIYISTTNPIYVLHDNGIFLL